MDMYRRYVSPLGYRTGNDSNIDSYGVDHSGFSTRDEIEYQMARQKRENELKTQYASQGITKNLPQYGASFWGNSANNYGFGMTNITDNIANIKNTTNPIPQATLVPQQQTQNNMQSQNTLSEVYDIYKDKGLLGLGMQYAEPSVKTAIQAAKWLEPIPISDVNKHQYVSCIGATGGLLAAAETLGGGAYKEYEDYQKKVNNPRLLKEYGGKWGVLSDNFKDFGNDIIGVGKGFFVGNPQECEELLPIRYRNKRNW